MNFKCSSVWISSAACVVTSAQALHEILLLLLLLVSPLRGFGLVGPPILSLSISHSWTRRLLQAVAKKKKETARKQLAKILTQVLADCKKAEGLLKVWWEVFSVSPHTCDLNLELFHHYHHGRSAVSVLVPLT